MGGHAPARFQAVIHVIHTAFNDAFCLLELLSWLSSIKQQHPREVVSWEIKYLVECLEETKYKENLTPEMLLRMMDCSEHSVWLFALAALNEVAKTEEALVPVLIRGLSSPNCHARRHCAEWLGSLGPAASSAIPALSNALGDKYYRVRYYAAWALGEMGDAAQIVLRDLNSARRDPDETVKRCATAALEKLTGTGPRMKSFIPQKIAAMLAKVGIRWPPRKGD